MYKHIIHEKYIYRFSYPWLFCCFIKKIDYTNRFSYNGLYFLLIFSKNILTIRTDK